MFSRGDGGGGGGNVEVEYSAKVTTRRLFYTRRPTVGKNVADNSDKAEIYDFQKNPSVVGHSRYFLM